MSIKKIANMSNAFCQALNNPDNWEEINTSIVKTASIDKTDDLGNYDLKSAVKEYPEHLFVKIFAIKANETNEYIQSLVESEDPIFTPGIKERSAKYNYLFDSLE